MLFEFLSPVQQKQAFYRFGDGSLIVYYHCLPASRGLGSGQIGLIRFALETYTLQNQSSKSPDDRQKQLAGTFGATLLYECHKGATHACDSQSDVTLQRLWLLHPYQINHLVHSLATLQEDQDDPKTAKPNFKYHSNKGLHERLGESTPMVVTDQQSQESWFFSSMLPQVRDFFDGLFFTNQPIGVCGQGTNILSLEGALGRFVVNEKGNSVSHVHTRRENSLLRQAWVLPKHNNMDATFEEQSGLHKDLYELLKQLLALPLQQQMNVLALADILKSIQIQDQKELDLIVPVEPPIFFNADYKYLDFSYLLRHNLLQSWQDISGDTQAITSAHKKYLVHDDMHIMKLSQLADVSLASVLEEHTKKLGLFRASGKLSPITYQSFIRHVDEFQLAVGAFHHYVRFGLGVANYEPGKTNGLFYFNLPKTAILVGLLATLDEFDTMVSTSPTVFAALLSQQLHLSYCGFAFPGVAKSQMSFVKQLLFSNFKQEQQGGLAIHSISDLSASQQTIKEIIKKSDIESSANSTTFFGVLESGKIPPTPLPFIYGKTSHTFGQAGEERYLFLSVTQESIIRMVLALNMQLNSRIQRVNTGICVVHDIDGESQQALFSWLQVYYARLYIAKIPNEFAGVDGYIILFTDAQELPEDQKELEERIAGVGKGSQGGVSNTCVVDSTPSITDDETLLAWAWRIILERKMLRLSTLVSQASEQQVQAEYDDSHLYDIYTPVPIGHAIDDRNGITPLLGNTQDIKQIYGSISVGMNTSTPADEPTEIEVSVDKPADVQPQINVNPGFSVDNIQNFEDAGDDGVDHDGQSFDEPEAPLDDLEETEYSFGSDEDETAGLGDISDGTEAKPYAGGDDASDVATTAPSMGDVLSVDVSPSSQTGQGLQNAPTTPNTSKIHLHNFAHRMQIGSHTPSPDGKANESATNKYSTDSLND